MTSRMSSSWCETRDATVVTRARAEVRTRRRRRTDGRSFLSFSRTDVRDDDVRDDDDDDAFVEPMRAPRAIAASTIPEDERARRERIGATIVGDGDEERVLGRGARRGGWDQGNRLSLLLKMNPLISDLRLYDLQGTPGVAADFVAHEHDVPSARFRRRRAIGGRSEARIWSSFPRACRANRA